MTPLPKAALAAALAATLGAVVLVVTPSASAALVTTLTPTADTTVNSQKPSTNYGTSTTTYASPTSWKSFLRFPTAQIDDTAVITSAKLRIYGSTTSSSRWEVHPASGAWSEGTTYQTRPAWSAAILAHSATTARSRVWNDIQLPVSAVSKTAPTNLGVMGTVSGKIGFHSRENTNDPQLVLTYGTTPTTPAPSPTATATPTTVPTTGPLPVGVPGSWTLAFGDEFNGTTLDTSKWVALNNWTMNNVLAMSSNVSVANGSLNLRLSDSGHGAFVSSSRSDGAGVGYLLPVGAYTEARVYFPGADGTDDIHNWPAWWTSGPGWPAAGEHDVAEGLGGDLTVNYHGTTNSRNYGTSPGDWNNAFHTYGVHRKATSADVYWDGVLVKSYPTGDNGAGESLLFNVGKSSSRAAVTGQASEVKVDYVRVWR